MRFISVRTCRRPVLVALANQQITQHATARKGIFQMQLVDPVHQGEIRVRAQGGAC